MFIDLEKAYDYINWAGLFQILVLELGVDAEQVATLKKIYTGVWG